MSGLLVFVSGIFVGAAALIILALSLGAQEWAEEAIQERRGYEPQTDFLRGAEPLHIGH